MTLARSRQAICAFENVNTEASGRSEIPCEQAIRETLPLVDYRRLILKDKPFQYSDDQLAIQTGLPLSGLINPDSANATLLIRCNHGGEAVQSIREDESITMLASDCSSVPKKIVAPKIRWEAWTRRQ